MNEKMTIDQEVPKNLRWGDKSKWRKGPWTHEPDRVEWRHRGFPCLIVRSHMGVLCGYVGLSPDHPFYEKAYQNLNFAVHGGLSYSDHCRKDICHIPLEGEPDQVWWLGFDCGHGGDFIPSIDFLYYQPLEKYFKNSDKDFLKVLEAHGPLADPTGALKRMRESTVYRDLSYVTKEVETLALQCELAKRYPKPFLYDDDLSSVHSE